MSTTPCTRVGRYISLYAVACAFLPYALALSQQCYDQNGNELSTSRALPCNLYKDKDGPCCAPGDICLSNGLCTPGPDLVNIGMTDTYKPTCTDGTWTVDTCFSGCNSFDGWGMKQCGDNRFCCFANNSTGCDCASTSLFELDAATFVTTLPISSMLSTSTSLPASASASTTPASRPASESTSAAASSSPSEQVAPQSSSHNVAIGAGVGAGVGVPLLAAVGVLAWYLHRRSKLRAAALQQGTPYPIEETKGSSKVRYAQMGSANELSAERRYEMDGIPSSQEIDGTTKYRRDA